MRDAIHVQPFRIPSEMLDVDAVVHQSAVKELAALKALAALAPVTGVGKQSSSQAAQAISPTPGNSSMEHPRPWQISQLLANS